jgi:HEXXH motif-containing protein
MFDLPASLLCLPKPTDTSTERLRRKVRLLALRRFLVLTGEGLEERAVASLRRIQAHVQAMARKHTDIVLSAIGQPDVLAPLLVLESARCQEAPLILGMIPPLLVHLAKDGEALNEALVWEAAVHSVSNLEMTPPAKALLVDPVGVAVELEDGRRLNMPVAEAQPGVRLSEVSRIVGEPPLGVQLSLNDGNPISMDEAHPEKTGNAVSLGERSLDEWCRRVEEAMAVIAIALPTWYQEMRVSLDRMVPVGFDAQRHFSASYREAPGTIYLSLHPSTLTMAEAIVHEVQHGKLNLLTWLDPVLHNGYSDWSPSPVRPDLRPLMGVLLAVHAFVPVSALHWRLNSMDHPLSREPGFSGRQSAVLAGNATGLGIVQARGNPSATGRRVLVGLQALHDVVARDVVGIEGNQMPM